MAATLIITPELPPLHPLPGNQERPMMMMMMIGNRTEPGDVAANERMVRWQAAITARTPLPLPLPLPLVAISLDFHRTSPFWPLTFSSVVNIYENATNLAPTPPSTHHRFPPFSSISLSLREKLANCHETEKWSNQDPYLVRLPLFHLISLDSSLPKDEQDPHSLHTTTARTRTHFPACQSLSLRLSASGSSLGSQFTYWHIWPVWVWASSIWPGICSGHVGIPIFLWNA